MIRTHDAGHWLEVILDRPERRNALTGPMYEELADIIDQADQNQKYRALILTGAGEHFCAGNDISELSNVRNSDMPPPIKFLRSLVQADIPLIVAVEGHAVGGTVALSFDEMAGLYEHAARATGRVENDAMVGLDDVDDGLDD